jgi:hypothetical protein
VRFHLEQRFDAELTEVEAALLDPAFLAQLATLPKLGRPTLLEQRADGDIVRQKIRYAFVGELSSAVRAVVDPERLTWVEDSTVDRQRHHTDFAIIPDHYASLLRAAGTFQLESSSPNCRRVADGEVHVGVPLVGRKVEAAIISGLAEHAAAETEVMHEWLSRAR